MFYLLNLLKPITFNLFGLDDTITGGIIAGGLSGLGSFFGGTQAANTSAAASRWATQKQLDWEREKFAKETELANTAHQREIADLEAAGLNKILTVNGSGANTPTAGSINPPSVDTSGIATAYQGLGNTLLYAINSAQQVQKTSEEISQIKATSANLDADSKLKGLQAITESYRRGLISAQTARELSDAEINKLKLTSDKRWLDWERGSNVFKNISLPILTAIGTFGSFTKLGQIGKMFEKMQKNDGQRNIYNYYNNYANL